MRPATALVLLALVPIGIWVTGASPSPFMTRIPRTFGTVFTQHYEFAKIRKGTDTAKIRSIPCCGNSRPTC